MSLQLMKERIKHSGTSAREEMIIDGQNLLKEELEHDSSYSPTMYFWNPVLKCDDKLANVRIYNRKYSSLNGNYQNFLTTHDNPVKIGDYFHDLKDDTYWLVYNSFNVDDVHYEGKMIQCNYLLTWQLSDSTIIKRWANIVSASKYDVGENGNSTITLSSNNYTILIGYCEEGFKLDDKRIFIDIKRSKPTKVFKITRSDDVLYNAGNMGALLSFIADKAEFNPNTDNQELRICDYIPSNSSLPSTSPPLDETTDSKGDEVSNSKDIHLEINSGGDNYLFAGGGYKTFCVNITDNNGEKLSDIPVTWEVTTLPQNEKYIKYEVFEDKIKVKSLYDSSILGSKILLTASASNIKESLYVEIGGGV